MKKFVLVGVIGICVASVIVLIALRVAGNGRNVDNYSEFEQGFKDYSDSMEIDNLSDEYTEEDIYVREYTEEELDEINKTNVLTNVAQQYERLKYRYKGELPVDIKEMPEQLDRTVVYGSLCAIEEFCGTDFVVLAAEQIGYGWIILFENAGVKYACTTGDDRIIYTICDATVWGIVVDGDSVSNN